ncbi:hypothetical protein RI367_007582 [Sorochytrium milnesiophthora]
MATTQKVNLLLLDNKEQKCVPYGTPRELCIWISAKRNDIALDRIVLYRPTSPLSREELFNWTAKDLEDESKVEKVGPNDDLSPTVQDAPDTIHLIVQVLDVGVSESQSNKSQVLRTHDSAEIMHLEQLFDAEYHDPWNNVQNFAAWLSACCAKLPGGYFAPYTSIVQSSGCGKSRLIKELANEDMWVFYICLRERSSNVTPGAAGYPCRSTIADHEAFSPVTTAVNDCRDNCCYLLAACMTHLTELVEENRTNPIEFLKKQLAYDENFVSGGEFWKQVQKVEMQLLATPQQTPTQPRSEKEKKQMLSQRAEDILEGAYTQPQRALARRTTIKHKRCSVLIAFDEARILTQKPLSSGTVFERLRSALSALRRPVGSHRCFAVFIDTMSRLSNFQPERPNFSKRSGERGVDLFPPFIDLAFFDIHRPDDMDEDVCRRVQQYISNPGAGAPRSEILVDLQLSQARSGRPLFAVEASCSPSANDVVNLARLQKLAVTKLCGGLTPAALRRPKTEDDNNDSDNGIDIDIDNASLLSALQFHAAIEVNPSQKIASDMVAACMSVCGFVSEDRRSISVGAPSEPFLAQAASTLLYDDDNIKAHPLHAIFCRLSGYIKHGMVQRDYRGELGGRLLLSIANWQAQRQADNSSLYTVPITVEAFLGRLLGEGHRGIIDHQLPTDLAKALKSGVVYFNHFVPIFYDAKSSDMKTFFARCAAIVCKLNHSGVDLIVPVMLREGAFTFILVQFSNSCNSNDSRHASQDITPEKCLLVDTPHDYPYLVLYMQFGGTPKIDGFRDVSPPTLKPAKGKKSPHKNKDEDQGDADEAQHRKKHQALIRVFGVDAQTYPCLETDDDEATQKNVDQLRSLLGTVVNMLELNLDDLKNAEADAATVASKQGTVRNMWPKSFPTPPQEQASTFRKQTVAQAKNSGSRAKKARTKR